MSHPRPNPPQRLQRIVQHLQPAHTAASSGAEAPFESPLTPEREAATFPVQKLTHYLDGGKQMTAIRELVQSSIAEDPVLNDPGRWDLTREESRVRTMRKISQVVGVIRSRNADQPDGDNSGSNGANGASSAGSGSKEDANANIEPTGSRSGAERAFEDAFFSTLSSLDPSWSTKMGVHFGLFLNAINGSGTEAQRAKYAKLVQEMRIVGAFAMTEMLHGSYVAGLQTTATFDVKSQMFTIRTPTLGATKWWIGGAGQTSTHAAVFARLITPDGVDRGVQTFVVQLRCLQTGKPMPNVRIGDMGAKLGRNGLDNGWIQFDGVQVPRDAMLMRWAQVDEQGRFTPPPNRQMSFVALTAVRIELFKLCSRELQKALTIAIRYSIVRRQFPKIDGKGLTKGAAPEETKLLDYPTHQARLFPILAHAFAFHFTAISIQRFVDSTLENLEANLLHLPALHASSAGLKAVGTWATNEALEVCRQCLGGMGYSSYSALPDMAADWAVMPTWEGDNTVLSLQTARYLLKHWAAVRPPSAAAVAQATIDPNEPENEADADPALTAPAPRGKIPRVLAYLARVDFNERLPANLPDDAWLDPSLQQRAFDHRVARCLAEVSGLIVEERRAHGVSQAVAAQRHSVACVQLARMHSYTLMLRCFQECVQAAPKEIKDVLKLVCDVFAIHEISTHLSDWLECGFISPSHCLQLRRVFRTLLLRLRPHALPLVDSFALPDFLVQSPLGRYDGDVYRALFQQINAAPNASGPTSYFEELIRPLTDPNYKPPQQ